MVITPPRQSNRLKDNTQPQVRADDGYFYPADGSSDGARYPAPRSSRRLYDARANQQPRSNYITTTTAIWWYNRPTGLCAADPYYQPRGLFE